VTASLPLLDRVRLGLGYDWYVRTYDERQAQSADGTIGATNPTLEYRYNRMTLAVMLDLESTQLNIAYDLTDRADQFVGYSDYRRHAFRINGSWRPMRRLTLEFLGTAESYAYENAYAFDVPQGGRKTLDYVGGELHARFSLTRHLQLWAGARYWNSDSSDPRIAYTRAQFPVGLAWAQRF